MTPSGPPLTPVAVVLLSLLHEGPMHPYELHQRLAGRGSARLVRINPGAVYHGIERLERDGLVEAARTERQGRRPERTLYRLTDDGRKAFVARVLGLLGEEHDEYPAFPVGLAEAHVAPLGQVVEQLEARRRRIDARLAEVRLRGDELREAGVARRYLLDVEHELAVGEAESRWLGALLEDLRSGGLGWGGGEEAEQEA